MLQKGRVISILLAAAAVAAVAACTVDTTAEFPAPDFRLKSPLTGRETSLSSLKGRPVMLYWFSSW